MISDAYVDFECDRCCNSKRVELPVMYSNYSGTDPHCDLRDDALEELLPEEWVAQDGKHICGMCKEDEE